MPEIVLSGNDLGGIDPAVTVGSVVVVSPVGMTPYAYLVRPSDKQIALLDTQATDAELSCRYTCHSFTGQVQDRESTKRILRIKVYGDGVVSPDAPTVPADRVFDRAPSGLMTVTADRLRTDTFFYSDQASEPWNGILWAQQCFALKGRTFDVDILLKGTGLKIREIGFEYIPSS